jgi:hypothetical protein
MNKECSFFKKWTYIIEEETETIQKDYHYCYMNGSHKIADECLGDIHKCNLAVDNTYKTIPIKRICRE